MIRWQSAACTNVGKRRKINEDAYLDRPDVGLWVVADGMGGHQSGDVASKMIVDSLQQITAHTTLGDYIDAVSKRLQKINAQLCALAEKSFKDQIIGSTVAVLMGNDERCAFLWAGDSRVYRYRKGKLNQLTRDHSLYGELREKGFDISDEIASQMSASNVITRAIGAERDLQLEHEFAEVLDGDIYLLCSDGLDKEVSLDEIEQILTKGNCDSSSKALVDLALERGARDNVTVIVIQAKKH